MPAIQIGPKEIAEIIERRGWNDQELADALFVSVRSVRYWKSGTKSPLPSIHRRLVELLENARKRDRCAEVGKR